MKAHRSILSAAATHTGRVSETLSFERPMRSRWTGVFAGVLVTALACFWVVSERRADKERAEVARCSSAVVRAVDSAEKRLAALASYIAPAVDSSSYRTFEGLYATLSAEAERNLPRVRTALQSCHRVEVWWLHRSVLRGRDAAVALGDAELGRLEAVQADGTTFHDGYDVIARLRDEAQRAE